MRSQLLACAALAIGTSLAGCAATTTSSKVVVDYNRMFAETRDEVLVTNILRASAREPLQFSTMGTVSGGVRNTGSVKVGLPELFAGGPSSLSPEFTINEGINPQVTILPLSDKQFTEGLLKPVSAETINYFLNQAWDPELVLQLTVGGIICSNGAVVANRGEPSVEFDPKAGAYVKTGSRYDQFARMFGKVPRFPIKVVGKSEISVIRAPAKEALLFLKDGVGKERKIEKIEGVKEKGVLTDMVEITILKPAAAELTGLDTSEVCAGLPPQARNEEREKGEGALRAKNASGQDQGTAILRSIESIIYYLGETHRARWEDAQGCIGRTASMNWPDYRRTRMGWRKELQRDVHLETQLILFKLQKACGSEPIPYRNFTQTRFNGHYYYVPRQEDAHPYDRTLTTLSFLNALIALHVSESTITSSTPVIAIGAR